MYVFHTNQIGSTINNQTSCFVADTCNMILLFASFKWYLDTFVFHGQKPI